jgi:hypothetical protein
MTLLMAKKDAIKEDSSLLLAVLQAALQKDAFDI